MKQQLGIGKNKQIFILIFPERTTSTCMQKMNMWMIRDTRSLEDIFQRCSLVISEPVSYDEAQDSQEWKKVMQAELDMINKNGT